MWTLTALRHACDLPSTSGISRGCWVCPDCGRKWTFQWDRTPQWSSAYDVDLSRHDSDILERNARKRNGETNAHE